MKIVIVPGYLNSDEQHWQSLWERELNAIRVHQESWAYPERSDWVAGLDALVSSINERIVLVAHSLGCPTVAFWSHEASKANLAKVAGALLVAPPDAEQQDFPAQIKGYSPVPSLPLPFPSVVIASSNDPYCEFTRAVKFAHAWQSEFHSVGAKGHINSQSNLSNWPDGQRWLQQLISI